MRRFVVAALAVALVMAVGVSPWADASPDGLESVAREEGFAARERAPAAAPAAPFAGYATPGAADARLSTALAGLTGTLGVCAVGAGTAIVLGRRAASR